MEKNKKQQGFTLIELLIYITLVALISVIFTNFTADVVKNASRSLVVKEVTQNTRLILSRISQEIKTASSVTSVSTNEITMVNQYGDSFDIGFNSINNLAYIDIAGGGDIAISSEDVRVTNLTFEEISDDAIEVNITVEQKNPTASEPRRYQLNLSTTVIPRPGLY